MRLESADGGESEDWVRVQEGRGLELGDVEIG